MPPLRATPMNTRHHKTLAKFVRRATVAHFPLPPVRHTYTHKMNGWLPAGGAASSKRHAVAAANKLCCCQPHIPPPPPPPPPPPALHPRGHTTNDTTAICVGFLVGTAGGWRARPSQFTAAPPAVRCRPAGSNAGGGAAAFSFSPLRQWPKK
ncbi:hypothetical protein niasHT_016410 [Heterodera trifolii]|uniref:Uncharacterized protein n=1 Tax=Heterodera trifolii TaxID=157864 RepID=A0ABD2LJ45_9BILA